MLDCSMLKLPPHPPGRQSQWAGQNGQPWIDRCMQRNGKRESLSHCLFKIHGVLFNDFFCGTACEASKAGRVKTVSPKGIFVDVGAMVDSYLPQKKLKGARSAQFQEGLEVKVKVETVTNNRIILALEEVDNLLGLAEDLELGKSYVGKVLEVNEFGAVVDLGVDRRCWLHVSEMELPEGVTRIEEDQEVTVRIKQVRPKEVDLTMLDLPEFHKKPLSDFQVGDELGGKVVAVSPKVGLFVDVGAMLNGLVPRDTLGKKPSEFQIGQEVNLKIRKLTNHRMGLLLKEL